MLRTQFSSLQVAAVAVIRCLTVKSIPSPFVFLLVMCTHVDFSASYKTAIMTWHFTCCAATDDGVTFDSLCVNDGYVVAVVCLFVCLLVNRSPDYFRNLRMHFYEIFILVPLEKRTYLILRLIWIYICGIFCQFVQHYSCSSAYPWVHINFHV